MIAGRIYQLAVLAVVALILIPQRVAGQASASEMAGFPMPPPGMSGVRNPDGKCVFATENDLTDIDSRFGWGTTFKSYNFASFVTDIVVGALSNTHGWGFCTVPSGSFVACHEPSYIIGYTLP
jgi:hypothetical protein